MSAPRGTVLCCVKQRISLLDRVPLGWLGGHCRRTGAWSQLMTTQLDKTQIETVSLVASTSSCSASSLRSSRSGSGAQDQRLQAFIRGARMVCRRRSPSSHGVLVAIQCAEFRRARDAGQRRHGYSSIGINADFCWRAPTALMKSVSGSGARAMMIDAIKTYGVDSFRPDGSPASCRAVGHHALYIAPLLRLVGIAKVRWLASPRPARRCCGRAGVDLGGISIRWVAHRDLRHRCRTHLQRATSQALISRMSLRGVSRR